MSPCGLRRMLTLPTGNWRPALALREVDLPPAFLPRPPVGALPPLPVVLPAMWVVVSVEERDPDRACLARRRGSRDSPRGTTNRIEDQQSRRNARVIFDDRRNPPQLVLSMCTPPSPHASSRGSPWSWPSSNGPFYRCYDNHGTPSCCQDIVLFSPCADA